MSIEILSDRCCGCGACIDICPGGLLAKDIDGNAVIKYPKDCWACASCMKECPQEAISLYLGEDIGGLGGRLSLQRSGRLIRWTVTCADGSKRTIIVDGGESNHY